MKLGVGDRLIILSILPREGDLATVRIVHELQQALSFSENEHAALGIRQEGEGIVWKGTDKLKEVPIGARAQVLIADALKALSDERKLTAEHLDVWGKFVEGVGAAFEEAVAGGE